MSYLTKIFDIFSNVNRNIGLGYVLQNNLKFYDYLIIGNKGISIEFNKPLKQSVSLVVSLDPKDMTFVERGTYEKVIDHIKITTSYYQNFIPKVPVSPLKNPDLVDVIIIKVTSTKLTGEQTTLISRLDYGNLHPDFSNALVIRESFVDENLSRDSLFWFTPLGTYLVYSENPSIISDPKSIFKFSGVDRFNNWIERGEFNGFDYSKTQIELHKNKIFSEFKAFNDKNFPKSTIGYASINSDNNEIKLFWGKKLINSLGGVIYHTKYPFYLRLLLNYSEIIRVELLDCFNMNENTNITEMVDLENNRSISWLIKGDFNKENIYQLQVTYKTLDEEIKVVRTSSFFLIKKLCYSLRSNKEIITNSNNIWVFGDEGLMRVQRDIAEEEIIYGISKEDKEKADQDKLRIARALEKIDVNNKYHTQPLSIYLAYTQLLMVIERGTKRIIE